MVSSLVEYSRCGNVTVVVLLAVPHSGARWRAGLGTSAQGQIVHARHLHWRSAGTGNPFEDPSFTSVTTRNSGLFVLGGRFFIERFRELTQSQYLQS